MKKQVIRFCQYCPKVIPDSRNKNSKYCSDDCYDDHKAEEAVKNNLEKAHSLVLLKNDHILHDLYLAYDPKLFISAKELITRGFNWSINKGEVIIENLKANTIIRYAYTLFINQTVRIWKL
jgi:hypothetical protein